MEELTRLQKLMQTENFIKTKYRSEILFECDYCNTPFKKLKKTVSKNTKKIFCSEECNKKSKITSIQLKCMNCSMDFIKIYSEYKRSRAHFCSSSCAASYNNRVIIKRQLEGICKKCSIPIHSSRVYCNKCFKDSLESNLTQKNPTYADILKSRKYQPHSVIRIHAQKIYFKNFTKIECVKCGYSKHIEVGHIKAIKDSAPTDRLLTINDPSNLLGLCPNCHWEFDNLPRGPEWDHLLNNR